MSILANCRHSDGCFGLLALISAVQPSKLLPDYSIPYYSPTPTGPCNFISLDCLAMPTPYAHMLPHHKGHTALFGLQHPFTPPYTRTHQHSQHHALTVTHMPTQHVLHTDVHVPSYSHSMHMCGTLAHKHSAHAHTQNMSICLCWYMQTPTHTHIHTHTQTQTCTHTQHKHARARKNKYTHTCTCTHLTPQLSHQSTHYMKQMI